MALRDRVPRVAAVFADGLVSYRAVEVIVWRTAQINDPAALAAIERTERGARSRGVTVHHDEAAGTAYLSCTMFGREAKALEQLVEAMSLAQCPLDP